MQEENYPSILIDTQIVQAVRDGELQIVDPDGRPLIDAGTGTRSADSGLDAHGYVLHLRNLYSWREGKWISLKGGRSYVLRPDEFIIAETYEKLSLMRNVCATIHALARLTLQGISHISTTVHPGWGASSPEVLRIGVRNMAPWPITLRDKQRIARMLLCRSSIPAQLVSAPTAKDIFQYMDTIIGEYQRIRNRQSKAVKVLLLLVGTFFVIVVASLLPGNQSPIFDWLKALGAALIGLWAAYMFRMMGL